MFRIKFASLIPRLAFLVWIGLSGSLLNRVQAENWPGWRGPRGDGTSEEKNVPIHWSATSNVLWKTEIPGVGHASPIVWDDKVFTVSTLADQPARLLFCLDRKSGRILWQ